VSLGFVDDTNLVVWSPSAQRNCQLLEGMHKTCLEWARKSGASFAPDKYQLIHLSRRKTADLTACISIPGFSGKPQKSLKVLGVWLDQQLNWKLHIREAAQKGDKQLRALARVVGSTWGLDFEKTRLLYNATVRSAFSHGAQVWALGDQGQGNPAKTTKPLVQVQHKSLRLVTGAFKATAGAGLEREVDIAPVPLYTQFLARKHARETDSTIAITYINTLTQRVADTQKIGRTRVKKQWRSPRQHAIQAIQKDETACRRHENENQRTPAQRPSQLGSQDSSQRDNWLEREWEKQFTKLARRRRHPVWKPHHKTLGKELRAGLNRSESSIVTQLRTGNIGLREYLATRKVPEITPNCSCGFPKETIPHFLLYCTKRQGRAAMMLQTNTQDLEVLLCEIQPIQAVARWIFREGLLPQFQFAKKLLDRQDPTDSWTPIGDIGTA
jgi:hypothetical protein